MQGNESFRLVVRRGPQPNQSFELNKDIITLGRDITNDIVINDPEVSRHHLRFTRGASGYNVEDLGSTNGTFIGGQRLTGVRPLNRGDMISLGETVTLGYEVIRPQAESPNQQPPPYSRPSSEEQQPPQQQQPPPQQQPQPGDQQAPYAPPQYGGQQSQYDYSPQQQPPPPQQDYGQPPQDYNYQQPAGYQDAGYAPSEYGYDPYAVREEEGSNTTRWLLIGCGLLLLFCCCSSVVGLVVIDALNLWYDLPIVRDIAPLFESIAEALGLI